MIKLLVKRFIPNYSNYSDPIVRKKYGVFCGVLGIICNLLLFVIKITVGAVTGSIAVVSDAFNNLSDLGSSAVSVVGARLSGKIADKEHPYGHGRGEYISSLIIGILIIFFGIELLKSSVSAIITPTDMRMNATSFFVLAICIPVKLWMWYYNKVIGRKIQSPIMAAASKDSLNDIFATTGVIASAVISPYTAFPVDGAVGLVISAIVFWTGFEIAKKTIDRLLGLAPSEDLIKSIEEMLMQEKFIIGIHDLMVHDYGPGRTIASVHAEVPDSLSLVEVHNAIDKIEHNILDELYVDIVVHMDPVPHKSEDEY